MLKVCEGINDSKQGKPMKGIVPRTNLNLLTQLCMLVEAITLDYNVENGDPQVFQFVVFDEFLLTLCSNLQRY